MSEEAAERPYEAILILSFGGPESPDDVMPFLENVTRGRGIPRERLLEVAEHYLHFGGKSPINQQNRALMAALQAELEAHGPHLPVYWGNRNWHPFLADTLRKMSQDGIGRALGFVTSAYSSYSGCRQYREDILRARDEVGPQAPQVDKLRVFYNHPGFIAPMGDAVRQAFAAIPAERRERAALLFSAHSVPLSMAQTSQYVPQLEEAARLVSQHAGRAGRLVYQSRSGPPTQPWLEPDVLDVIRELHAAGVQHVVILPIGFISDHMEVLYDLDTEAKDLCAELGMTLVRAATVGTDPRFVSMIRELIQERLEPGTQRRALGLFPPHHDFCPADCCPAPPRRPVAAGGPAAVEARS